MTNYIYLDYNATTPVDSAVLDGMNPWFSAQFWNAASSHRGGMTAAEAVSSARDQVASLLGSRAGEIIWTSGATEANNLAIKGFVELASPTRSRVITFATEHKAVLDVVAWIGEQGHPTSVLGVNEDGAPDLEALRVELLKGDTALVSVMAANNETGILVDLGEIARLAHEGGAQFHTDATQAVGKLSINVEEQGIDLLSMSAHKIYGPKGIGALFVSRKSDVASQVHGGGHERGMRSGTLNVPSIVGFGLAAELAAASIESELPRQARLVATFLEFLENQLGDGSFAINTQSARRLTNTVNLWFEGADADAVMANSQNIAISSGSACTALVTAPSHVLTAMGFDTQKASECLRISVGRPTTETDVELAAESIATAVRRVRELMA